MWSNEQADKLAAYAALLDERILCSDGIEAAQFRLALVDGPWMYRVRYLAKSDRIWADNGERSRLFQGSTSHIPGRRPKVAPK